MNSFQLSLRDAAEILGISKDTVWRAVQRGELQARLDSGPAGDQYWLSQTELQSWWTRRKNRKNRAQVGEAPQNEQTDIPSEIAAEAPQATQNETAALATLSAAPQEYEIVEGLAAPNVVPVEVHLQALRLVERAQLQLEHAQHELRNTRNILSEQAESLAEKEAYAKQAALMTEKAAALAQETAALEQENLRNRERWESERAELLKTIQDTKGKVDWLERRVPKWVRKVFGAG